MTRVIRPLIVLVLFCGLCDLFSVRAVSAQANAPVNVTGRWVMALDMSMGPSEPLLELKQDGDKITGTYTGRYGSFPLAGTIKARKLAFTFTMGSAAEPVEMAFTGEVLADGESMKGEASLASMGDATWTAKREKEKTK